MGSFDAHFESVYFAAVAGEGCPYTSEELDSAVESELLRARVKRVEKWIHVHLFLKTSCMDIMSGADNRHTGYAQMEIAEWCFMATPDHGEKPLSMCSGAKTGQTTAGKTSKQYLIDSAMLPVRRALDDFLVSVVAARDSERERQKKPSSSQ
ncbi:hypothetical protein EYC87_05375 [Halieaceae bacterium IMCC8485]|uniref:Uncharacterized protein n=1 Tax=Candidatus Seongchinamella marina TaxID=2518990 RepID=A0ABT3SSR3_9GAMM|nr:hypothetical protein [Candidatus Seongchinamella marina]